MILSGTEGSTIAPTQVFELDGWTQVKLDRDPNSPYYYMTHGSQVGKDCYSDFAVLVPAKDADWQPTGDESESEVHDATIGLVKNPNTLVPVYPDAEHMVRYAPQVIDKQVFVSTWDTENVYDKEYSDALEADPTRRYICIDEGAFVSPDKLQRTHLLKNEKGYGSKLDKLYMHVYVTVSLPALYHR